MAEVILCSEAFLKAQTNISENIQGKFISSSLREAQEIKYKAVVGERMLDKLKALVSAGTIGLPANATYKALLDNSLFYIAYTAMVDICVKASFKISNAGVVKTSDENIQLATWTEIVANQEFYQSKADAMCYQLQNWMLDHLQQLPELTANDQHRIKTNLYSAASCGVWLGGARGKGSMETRRTRRGYHKYD